MINEDSQKKGTPSRFEEESKEKEKEKEKQKKQATKKHAHYPDASQAPSPGNPDRGGSCRGP
jgi:hypothetical protein